MPNFTVYNTRTGEVRFTGSMAVKEWCYMQAGDGESVYFGTSPRDHYILDGAPCPIPEQPSEHHTFNWATHTWNDERELEDVRAQLREKVADLRWRVETGGLDIPSLGIRIDTSRAARAAFSAEIAELTAAGVESVDFKANTGFRTLSLDDMRGIACGVTLHVQSCFTAERVHLEAIEALDSMDTAKSYDTEANWPS